MFSEVVMSLSGVTSSYWAAFNRIGGSQQRSKATSTVADIAQPSASTSVSISTEARAAAALAANNTQAVETDGTQSSHSVISLSTDKGQHDIDIDDYFTLTSHHYDFNDPKSLPPLFMPSPGNINALSKDASARLKAVLAAHHIPFCPSSISYDTSGQMQVPSDYPYADALKQTVKENPVLERELSTVNALTDMNVSMRASVAFSEDYTKATTKAEVDTILAKYHALFDGTQHHYKITFSFDADGNITPLADGKPYMEAQDVTELLAQATG